jgi:D-xylose transport system permease protein
MATTIPAATGEQEPGGAPSGFEGDRAADSLGGAVRAYVGRVRGGDLGALPAVLGILVLGLFFTVLRPETFLTPRNMANLADQAAPIIILAMGLVFVLLLGEIDLSAGVTGGVGMALFVTLFSVYNVPWPLALLLGFGFGFLTGALIGFFVARVGIPSFVVTLGLFLGYQGLALVVIGPGGLFRIEVPELIALQNGNLPVWGGWVMLLIILAVSAGTSFYDRARRTRAGVPNRAVSLVFIKLAVIAVLGGAFVFVLSQNRGQSVNEVAGVPIIVPIVLLILWIGTFVLDRTKFGRYVYAIGGNAEAARRSGVKVRWIKWWAFVICSSLAVAAMLFSVSRVGSVDATVGRDIVLSGVAAAVVGGVSLFGGRGRLMNAAVGALVIAVITNGLGLLNLPAGFNLMVTGGVLILAATVDAVSRLRSGGAMRV